jgi:tripartite-type tricarboxylate transporter receptor subunit TctC
VPLMIDIWHSARRYVESGDFKLIAGASLAPLPGAEATPTIAAMFPGVDAVAFNAAVGPGGMPGAVLERLSADIRTVVDSWAFVARAATLGIEAKGNTPAELATGMKGEIERWRRIVRTAKIMAE